MNLFRFITGRRLFKVPGLGRAHYARWCSGRYGHEEIQYRADHAGRNLEKPETVMRYIRHVYAHAGAKVDFIDNHLSG